MDTTILLYESMNISVIIPLYNGQEFIRRAILSVFNQTKLPIELIIVDDASTDDSVKTVEAMVPAAPIPVKIIKLGKNSGGPAKPLNTGVREAKGALISVLDQDDYFMPQKLEKLYDLLTENPDVRLVFSAYETNVAWEESNSSAVEFKKRVCLEASFDAAVRVCSKEALHYLLLYGNHVRSFSAFVFF